MASFRVLRPFNSFGPDSVGRIVEMPSDLQSAMLMQMNFIEPVDVPPVLPSQHVRLKLPEEPKGSNRARPRKDSKNRSSTVRPSSADEVHAGNVDGDAELGEGAGSSPGTESE